MVSLRTWAQQGVLHPIRTPGGHRRYLEDELLKAMGFDVGMTGGNRCVVASGQTDIIFIEYKDRLARFGFKYLEQFCHQFNVTIEETEDRPSKEPPEELVEDMIAIITSFSARIYGKRGGKIVKKIVNLVESGVSSSEIHS